MKKNNYKRYLIAINLSIYFFLSNNYSYCQLNSYNGLWKIKKINSYERLSLNNKEKRHYKKEVHKCINSIILINNNIVKIDPDKSCYFKGDTICSNFSINEDTLYFEKLKKLNEKDNLNYQISFDITNEDYEINKYIINHNIKYLLLNIVDCSVDWGDDKMFFLKINDILVVYCGWYYLVLKKS